MWFSKGKSDASGNLGQRNPSTFKSDTERKLYQAGRNIGK